MKNQLAEDIADTADFEDQLHNAKRQLDMLENLVLSCYDKAKEQAVQGIQVGIDNAAILSDIWKAYEAFKKSI